jgi:MFS family permease
MAPQQQISFNAWKTILVLCGSVIIFLYLNTGMSPALPSIEADFDFPSSVASWVMTAYMVCGAVMTVIMGRLADLFGAKKNANDNDDMFYSWNHPGTVCS